MLQARVSPYESIGLGRIEWGRLNKDGLGRRKAEKGGLVGGPGLRRGWDHPPALDPNLTPKLPGITPDCSDLLH